MKLNKKGRLCFVTAQPRVLNFLLLSTTYVNPSNTEAMITTTCDLQLTREGLTSREYLDLDFMMYI
jgi:hypothetical protein